MSDVNIAKSLKESLYHKCLMRDFTFENPVLSISVLTESVCFDDEFLGLSDKMVGPTICSVGFG